MTRTAGALIGRRRSSAFWGLGCPKTHHEIKDSLDTDIYAVSIYPYLLDGIAGNSEKIPRNLFSRVRSYIGDKPFGVAETGFNAKTWRVLSRFIWIPGNEESQAGYIKFLMDESNKLNAKFVNWWVPRDLDMLWERMKDAGADPVMSQWNSNGLVNSQGTPHQGLEFWKTWLKKPLKIRYNNATQPTADHGG
ncbi:MAG: hypothetical protein ABW170_02780 [Candidatus Thiodiazotropha sp. L084R]